MAKVLSHLAAGAAGVLLSWIVRNVRYGDPDDWNEE